MRDGGAAGGDRGLRVSAGGVSAGADGAGARRVEGAEAGWLGQDTGVGGDGGAEGEVRALEMVDGVEVGRAVVIGTQGGRRSPIGGSIWDAGDAISGYVVAGDLERQHNALQVVATYPGGERWVGLSTTRACNEVMMVMTASLVMDHEVRIVESVERTSSLVPCLQWHRIVRRRCITRTADTGITVHRPACRQVAPTRYARQAATTCRSSRRQVEARQVADR